MMKILGSQVVRKNTKPMIAEESRGSTVTLLACTSHALVEGVDEI